MSLPIQVEVIKEIIIFELFTLDIILVPPPRWEKTVMLTFTRFSAVADTLLALFGSGRFEKHLLRAQKCISSNRISSVKNRACMLSQSVSPRGVSARKYLLLYLKKNVQDQKINLTYTRLKLF